MLEIKGKVDRALKLSLKDIRKLKATEIVAVNQCSGNSRGFFAPRVAGGQLGNGAMIGAVVGVQPFGGHGLSGTGPKAGGPHYLARFATEQTVTINTAAAGGNAALLSGEE